MGRTGALRPGLAERVRSGEDVRSDELPKSYRFEKSREVLISRDGDRVILEPARGGWSRAFLELAGSAKDFPYPEEPPPAEPGPEFD